jgi:ribA/ribD-fused uncharacterized protein
MISKFWKEFSFLSNFFPVNIEFNGKIFPSVEHAYQAAKTLDKDEQEKIRVSLSPGKAKRLGKKVKLREGWNKVKLQLMENFLRQKFDNISLKQKLLNTKGHELVEGNNWGDKFWGCSLNPDGTFSGQNHLGLLLMRIRDEEI